MPTLSGSFLIRFIDITHIRVQEKKEEKNYVKYIYEQNQTKLNIDCMYSIWLCVCVSVFNTDEMYSAVYLKTQATFYP